MTLEQIKHLNVNLEYIQKILLIINQITQSRVNIDILKKQ